jgi:hypothetical protein
MSPFQSERFRRIRKASGTDGIDPALVSAPRVAEAQYERKFRSLARLGPACAVVDTRTDGAILWTGSQKPHFAHDGVVRALGLPKDEVYGIWVPGLLRAQRSRRRRDRCSAPVEGGRSPGARPGHAL